MQQPWKRVVEEKSDVQNLGCSHGAHNAHEMDDLSLSKGGSHHLLIRHPQSKPCFHAARTFKHESLGSEFLAFN